jgi:hypothetical protein
MVTRKTLVKKARCHVCGHADRALIEAARMAGASLDALAAKYGISRDAIWRHFKNHLSDEQRADILARIPMAELAERAAAEGTSVLQYFSIVRSTLMQQFMLCASVGDRNGTAILAGRITEVLREIGRITGELGSMAVNNLTVNHTVVLNSPVFANLQANLLTALAPFPDARAAVVRALQKMDEQAEPLPEELKVIEHVPTKVRTGANHGRNQRPARAIAAGR